MSTKRDFIVATALVFLSGEIVVTLVSFLFGRDGRAFWVVAQGFLLFISLAVAALAFAAKNSDRR